MRTTWAITTAGTVGLCTILYAAVYYRNVDAIAFAITLLMGLSLSLGIGELLWVARRTQQLSVELAALTPNPTYAHVTGASPLLRALLSARLDRTALVLEGDRPHGRRHRRRQDGC